MNAKHYNSAEINKIIVKLIPDSEINPKSIKEVINLPSFLEKIKTCEEMFDCKYAELDHNFQEALTLRRIQQLTNIALLNSLWKERINKAGLETAPVSFEEWQNIPICDKTTIMDFFSGSRPGMVVPITQGGFEIVASGGTSNGSPSETVYSLRELHDTYKIAGDFIGNYMLKEYLKGDDAKWMITTLADYQMWSSGTMVGGVLQHIPGINYIGAGPVTVDVYKQMMSYSGPKAIMGISQGIAILTDLGATLDDECRKSLHVAMYGSGLVHPKKQADLKKMYPNLSILSYFAATQAETIGLQLSTDSPYLASVPGLHLIEIVDENGRWVAEGEEGELVVTRLHATEVPVLRFKVGDRMIRRPLIDKSYLKTSQFEFSGRSSDVIHLCDTQYPIPMVYEALCREFAFLNIFDLKSIANETQFVNNRGMKYLTLLISVDNPVDITNIIEYKMGHNSIRHIFIKALIKALPIFNRGEASVYSLDKTEYQFSIRFVAIASADIHRTEVGKVPLLIDVL